jgi:hypothetical protein
MTNKVLGAFVKSALCFSIKYIFADFLRKSPFKEKIEIMAAKKKMLRRK